MPLFVWFTTEPIRLYLFLKLLHGRLLGLGDRRVGGAVAADIVLKTVYRLKKKKEFSISLFGATFKPHDIDVQG